MSGIHDAKEGTLLPCDGNWEIDGSKEFYRQHHGAFLLGELVSLHEDSILTDVVLKASCGSTFPCHRVILAASSPYFRAMFTNGKFLCWKPAGVWPALQSWVGKSSTFPILPQISIIFFLFFRQTLFVFGPSSGQVTHLGRPWLCH